MTISYSGKFGRLLFKWKGSIWKSVWKELLVYLILYYCIRLLYRYAMTLPQQEFFTTAILRFEFYTRYMPLTFILGFYIFVIINRWWDQFESIAWPDDVLSMVCVIISGSDFQSRLKRHIVARYLNLCSVMAWRNICSRVRRRFPTMDHLVASGLMTAEEQELCESVVGETNVTNGKWIVPLQWAQKIVQDVIAERKGSPALTSAFYNHLCFYRGCFRKLVCYDWVCIPLVYTQVAALATYGYFGFCLVGHQFLIIPEGNPEDSNIPRINRLDLYVPVYTILQFLFFVGWLKIGQDLMRPFGTDDDDFELNFILDRHIQTSFSLVDQVSLHKPSLIPDKFWKPSPPPGATYGVPHTRMSSRIKEHSPKLHGAFIMKREKDDDFLQNVGEMCELRELLVLLSEMNEGGDDDKKKVVTAPLGYRI